MEPLAAILEREVEQVSRFIAVLRDEQRILVSGAIDELEAIANAKQLLVENLNALESERKALFGDLDLPKDTVGAWFDTKPQLAGNWRELMALAAEAKDLHEHNGLLVNELLQKTNKALAILTASNAASAKLYGKDGQATESTGQRIVDSA